MKSAKEIANQVVDQYEHDRQYPVSKAQETVLYALGITRVNGASHAEQIFEALGITVSSRRVGRKSLPVVSRDEQGAFGPGGDGEYWGQDIDFSAISEWMV